VEDTGGYSILCLALANASSCFSFNFKNEPFKLEDSNQEVLLFIDVEDTGGCSVQLPGPLPTQAW
jgi:hypothetical protein